MKKTKTEIVVGETYVVKYPFLRERFEPLPEDFPLDSTCVPPAIHGWRPGTECDSTSGENFWFEDPWVADGEGEMLLTVISKHRPGAYPERVFYVRRWKDPDGKVFGKENLRVIATSAFVRTLKGYRHHYGVVE